MADQEITAIQIETDGGPIDVLEFSEFLYIFRAAYVVASERVLEAGISMYDNPEELYRFSEHLRSVLPQHRFAIVNLARKYTPSNLTILDIKRENPLEIVFGGISVALTAAVILSGGEFKGPGFKVKLPPLGTGISRLREAFGRKQKPKRRK